MIYEDSSGLSSPDPLRLSLVEDSTIPHDLKRAGSITPRKPLANTNNNSVGVQDFYLTTPSKLDAARSSPAKSAAENIVSPWRIRVTVEAEREEDIVNTKKDVLNSGGHPTRRLAERIITTTVPLKDAAESSPAPLKRGRGRPRKSLETPLKRAGTPNPTKGRRRKTQSDLEEDGFRQDVPLGQSPLKNARRRLRKSVGSHLVNTPLSISKQERLYDTPGTRGGDGSSIPASMTRRKSKGRRKAMTPMKIPTDSDASPADAVMLAVTTGSGKSTLSQTPHNSLDHSLKLSSEHATHMEASEHSRSQNICDRPTTADSVKQQNGYRNEDLGEAEMADPTSIHREFDSILESEGFSMVSTSSLDSAKQSAGYILTPAIQIPSNDVNSEGMKTQSIQSSSMALEDTSSGSSLSSEKLILAEGQSSSQQVIHENSLISHNLGDSPPESGHGSKSHRSDKGKTPLAFASSPSEPPSIQKASPGIFRRSLDAPTEGTPKLVRVVRTASALQGILDPESENLHTKTQGMRSSSLLAKQPQEHPNELFGGFGAGTKRELRAGLRLGEELAKRQQIGAKTTGYTQDDVFQEDPALTYPILPTSDQKEAYSLTIPSSQQQLNYPDSARNQLPSPERSELDADEDRMSWKADSSPARSEVLLAATEDHLRSSGFDNTMLAREAEWQQEREAVSRQIQMASESQVIIIHDDDSEDGLEHQAHYEEESQADFDDDDEDIWQEIAKSSGTRQKHHAETLICPETLFSEGIIKPPRRSKLPSPWRKSNRVIYSDEVASDGDMVWQSDLYESGNLTANEERISSEIEVSQFSVLSELIDETKTEEDVAEELSINHVHLSTASCFEENTLALLGGGTPRKIQVCTEKHVGREDGNDNGNRKVGGKSKEEYKKEDFERMLGRSHGSQRRNPDKGLEEPGQDRTNNEEQSMPQYKPLQLKPSLPSQRSLLPTYLAPTTWLSRLTSLVTISNPFTSVAPTTAPQTSPIRKIYSSKTSRDKPSYLSLYTPWNIAHYRALDKIYMAARANHSLYPYNPFGASTWLLDWPQTGTAEGDFWAKNIEEWELGVVDAFMVLLRRDGLDDRQNVEEGVVEIAEGLKRVVIGEAKVAKRVFTLWMGSVMRGEAGVGRGRRERM
ncbi:hypothetical protein MMC06_000750 [Schaereria dolodes]|nr:hypothetical protein [Schaereria dolodes]